MREIASQTLDLVRKLAPDAEVAVNVERSSEWLTRFATSFIHQNVASEATSVMVTMHADGRTTMGSTTLTDADGLLALAERTVAAARVAPLDPAWPGLAPASAQQSFGTLDPATAEATPDRRAEIVRAFVDAGGGLETAGYCRTLRVDAAHLNSAGQSLTMAATSADFDGIVRMNGADGVARVAGASLSVVDGAALGAKAAHDARTGVDPIELAAGRYEVVLRPEAVADILTNFSYMAFNGKSHNEGRCFARPGEAQFDPQITLLDDPVTPGSIGAPFDIEGTPRSALRLVDAGVTAALAYDRRSAAAAGAISTGHTFPGAASWGPVPFNLGFAPGGDEVEAMIRRVRRGLLVSDFWYTRPLDPRLVSLTGLTRNGVWLIEDGEITRPVRNLRFTQSYPQALGPGNVLGISSAVTVQPSRVMLSAWSCPTLHLAEWNFTGTSKG